MAGDDGLPFSSLLRAARRDAGLTQEELAERAGLSERAISDLERGVNRAPRKDTLDLLASALDLCSDERRRWDRERRRLSSQSPRGIKPAGLPRSAPSLPERWRADLTAWERWGATHASVRTFDCGLSRPEDHLDAIRRYREGIDA